MKGGGNKETRLSGNWKFEMLCLGFLGSIGGVLPVVVANRTVTFNFSQYGLPASLAGILILGGLVYSISPKSLRIIALCSLFGLASLTHQAVAYRAVSEEQAIYNFWWQMIWRVPSIRSGTTLVAQYPFDIADGDALIWGPANFIYNPDFQNQSPVVVPISAITLQPDTIKRLLSGKNFDIEDLIITNASFHYDYRNILVLTQSRSNACVRVINPTWLEYSQHDNGLILTSAPYSKIENVLLDSDHPIPPNPPFGSEPIHGWCYFYQKADLARQRGNWNEIVELGNEARKKGLHPNDLIEWVPFIQAYAYSGDIRTLNNLAKIIRQEPFYKIQTCRILKKMSSSGYPLEKAVLDEIDRTICEDH